MGLELKWFKVMVKLQLDFKGSSRYFILEQQPE